MATVPSQGGSSYGWLLKGKETQTHHSAECRPQSMADFEGKWCIFFNQVLCSFSSINLHLTCIKIRNKSILFSLNLQILELTRATKVRNFLRRFSTIMAPAVGRKKVLAKQQYWVTWALKRLNVSYSVNAFILVQVALEFSSSYFQVLEQTRGSHERRANGTGHNRANQQNQHQNQQNQGAVPASGVLSKRVWPSKRRRNFGNQVFNRESRESKDSS